MADDSERRAASRDNKSGKADTRVQPDKRNVVPSISLPKGGGALRSIDEKFTVNASNGTCELTVPLPFSKTRSGLDSALALHYSSGAGNSAFGLGWNVDPPSIQRRTDKQLPRYADANESDVFLHSGAEDLVPAYNETSPGHWPPDSRTIGPITVERYRPRIEGGFAKIEKVTVAGEAGFYWKVTSRGNVVTIFGRTLAARITAHRDPTRVFRWLPKWTYSGSAKALRPSPSEQSRIPLRHSF